MSVQTVFLPGLSPLARGTRIESCVNSRRPRFIPAGAGNTHSLARLNQLSPVYPRWRGEHSEYFADLFTDRGLSPLARGTRGNSFLDAALLRFIPAGAGNTLPSLVDEKSITVYPRWRGEHGGRIFYIPTVRGLSPLARGTLDRKYAPIDEKRFIPAGAGNTRARIQLDAIRAVYPRWRGEHTHGKEVPSGGTGLSPLARGTPKNKIKAMFSMRFIPAGAGNTLSIHNCF